MKPLLAGILGGLIGSALVVGGLLAFGLSRDNTAAGSAPVPRGESVLCRDALSRRADAEKGVRDAAIARSNYASDTAYQQLATAENDVRRYCQ